MKTKKLVMAGLMSAVVFLLTAFLKIALPGGGYANLGDMAVLLSGVILDPVEAFLAAGIGSALADALWFPVYIPITFILKGLMAFIVSLTKKKQKPFLGAAIPAEVLMVAVYLCADALIFHPVTALSALAGNIAQGVIGCAAAAIVTAILKKNKAIGKIDKE